LVPLLTVCCCRRVLCLLLLRVDDFRFLWLRQGEFDELGLWVAQSARICLSLRSEEHQPNIYKYLFRGLMNPTFGVDVCSHGAALKYGYVLLFPCAC